MAKAWRSNAEWPCGLIHNGVGGPPANITEDGHDTKEQAEAVCRMLERDGFGGERVHFPIRTWVEPIFTPVRSKSEAKRVKAQGGNPMPDLGERVDG
jgi:hypothetical protein